MPLVIKVLAKTMDTSLSPDKVELSTLTKDGDQVGCDAPSCAPTQFNA